jgi:hypothetical protein
VSILCFILVGYLFVQEVLEFNRPAVTSVLSVDTSRRREVDFLNITVLIELPSISPSLGTAASLLLLLLLTETGQV